MATRLLLADDSITIQKVVELVLSEEGFEIKAVNNGEEALQVISQFRPDVVLADIEMPKVNGYQLCERIKSNPATAGIPVILLAGAFEPVDEDLAAKVGAQDHIVKPFESQDLINKISEALSQGAAPAGAEEEVYAATEEAEEEAYAMAEVEAGPEAEAAGEDLWAMEGLPGQEEEALETAEGGFQAEEAYAVAEEEPGFSAGDFGIGMETGEEVYAAEEEPEAAAEETVAVSAVSAGEISKVVGESVQKSISKALASLDLNSAIAGAISAEIKNRINGAVEQIVREAAPVIIQSVVREAAAQVSSAMRKDIEKIIWETVPDLAESVIRKEIEAIKAGL